ncbi:unnamed protein product [Trichogramma brassicae]|uniref:Uncharacterized protein n=1 Tax=Trichogramma brassicae TaxID=86971 RepID=A0A6H5HZ80_9HYME|nr:unnamed protein product [Trichogramma brassicae]
MFSLLVHPDGLFGAPGTNTNSTTFFPKGSRDFLATLDTPGGLFGAPGTNTAPTTTFSQEVEMFSLLCPPRWPIRCTRYKYNLVTTIPQGSRDVFATLSTWVAIRCN